jgi:hypothetical protein
MWLLLLSRILLHLYRYNGHWEGLRSGSLRYACLLDLLDLVDHNDIILGRALVEYFAVLLHKHNLTRTYLDILLGGKLRKAFRYVVCRGPHLLALDYHLLVPLNILLDLLIHQCLYHAEHPRVACLH